MYSKSAFVAFGVLFAFSCLIARATSQQQCPPPGKVMFCYYSSWAMYRNSFGKYNVSDIDPFMCTHLVYAFAGLNIEGITFALDPLNDLPENGGAGQYYDFRQLREKNPCVKIMLSIGGWNEGSEKYSIMAETEESRSKFVDHLLRYLVYYGFDGVDLDWEYPASRGGLSIDKENYIKLLKAIKDKLTPRGKLLAVAVGATKSLLETSYDAAAMGELVDYVLLMTYDYHRPDVTSHVAPLYRKEGDINSGSIDESVQSWLDIGFPIQKLVLGILTSGRSYTLEDAKNNGLGAKVLGVGTKLNYTNIDGFISYYEICELIFYTGWTIVTDDTYANNYMTKGDQWITYEDKDTAKLKTSYIMSKNLAGAMVWTIDTDDFLPFCDINPNSIQKSIKEGLGI